MKKNSTVRKVLLTTAAASIVTPAVTAYATEITIQPGDTLSDLAVKYNTTVSELKRLNNLTSDLIIAGNMLKIPDEEAKNNSTTSLKNDKKKVYEVKHGDSLWKISKTTGINIDAIKNANGLDSDLIFVGQKLKLEKGNQKVAVKKSNVTSNTDTYVIQSGDTLSKVAKETGVSINQLKEYNQLKSDRIYAGETLNLKPSKDSTQKPKVEIQNNEVKQQSVTTVKSEKIEGSTYTVQAGDSLWKIARNSGIEINRIKQLNNLTSDAIYVGMTLQLNGEVTPVNNEKQEQPKQEQPKQQPIQGDTYTVQAGDTLSKIASQTDVSVDELKRFNNLISDRINVGMKLALKGTAKPAQQPQQSQPQQQNVQANQSTNQSTYTVQAGDTLSSISQKFNVSIDTLKALNPEVNNGIVYINQQLKVTGSPKQTAAPQGTGNLISTAKQYMGVPYVFGGSTPNGFDCSGFTQYVFKKNGKSIPRTAAAQYNAGQSVSQPQVGDMVFFQGTYKSGISHNGIYVGNGQFIHADSTKGVTISSLSNSYWAAHYAGAKRY